MKQKFLSLLLVFSILLVPVSGTFAQVEAERPDVATPIFADELPSDDFVANEDLMAPMLLGTPGVFASSLQAGGDRLAALQNNDGGWDWPLDDGNPANASPLNTVGPIAMGLAEAYTFTGDPDHLDTLEDAGDLLLTKINNFSPSDGYLADHAGCNFWRKHLC